MADRPRSLRLPVAHLDTFLDTVSPTLPPPPPATRWLLKRHQHMHPWAAAQL